VAIFSPFFPFWDSFFSLSSQNTQWNDRRTNQMSVSFGGMCTSDTISYGAVHLCATNFVQTPNHLTEFFELQFIARGKILLRNRQAK
jgi:hypothetical protein